MPNNEDTITDLLPAQPLDGSELIAMDQGNPIATVHAPIQAIADFLSDKQTVIQTSVSPIDTRQKFLDALAPAIDWGANGNYILQDVYSNLIYHVVYIANGASNQTTANANALVYYSELDLVQ